MPIIKSAIKKMHQDKKRTLHNKRIENNLKQVIKTMRKNPSAKNLTPTFSALDKAVKTHLIHQNRASRLKSRLSKLVQISPKTA